MLNEWIASDSTDDVDDERYVPGAERRVFAVDLVLTLNPIARWTTTRQRNSP